MKRILSVLLTLCIVLSLAPINMAHAAEDASYPEMSPGILELDMAAGETVYYQFTPSETGIYWFDASASQYATSGIWTEIGVDIYTEEEGSCPYSWAEHMLLEAGQTYFLSAQNQTSKSDENGSSVSCAAKAILKFKMLDYPELEPGVKTTATILGDEYDPSDIRYNYSENGDHAYFLIKPEKTETYTIRSFSNVETYGEIRDSASGIVGYGYYNGDRNLGFIAECTLKAGEIYYLSTGYYKPEEMGTGSYEIMIEVSHDYSEEVIAAGTCTTEGTSKFTCSHCGDSYTAGTSIQHTYVNNYCCLCGIKEVYSGSCGDNLTWEVDCTTGVLTISGTGKMYNYCGQGHNWGNNYPGWFKQCFGPDYKEYRWSSIVIEDGVTYIGDYAFSNLYSGNVSRINIPDSVVEIGDYSFDWNRSLTSLTLSDSLKAIGSNAFQMCEALPYVRIPNSVTNIGDFAFAGCSALSDLLLGNNVKTIGAQAFGGISSASITIPKSVTYLGGSIFAYSGLQKIRFEGSAPAFGHYDPVGDGTQYQGQFDGITATVSYPAGNPTWKEEVMQDYGGTITWVPYKVYTVLSDSDTTVIAGNSESATVHVDGALADFVSVSVDGDVVDASSYTLSEGSTIVTFHAEYLDTLSRGEHRVTVEFTDGYAYCDLTIAEKAPCDDGHTEETVPGKAATCTETGLTDGVKCAVCGEVLTEQEVIPAAGHSWDEGTVTKQPTEVTEGEKTYTCTVCGETRTESIPALEHSHSYASDVTAPTCTEQGYTTYTCACGDSYVADYVDALGHTEETVPGTAATCTETGLTEGKKCSVCDEVLVPQEEIPAKGHTFENGKCTVCGETDPNYVAPVEPVLSGVIRIAGADRIETSLKLAKQLQEVLGAEKFDAVVVASALNFPDALTGSYLAAEKKAPILLTYPDAHEKIVAYIEANLKDGGTAYILGGESAVDKDFENLATAKGMKVQRVAGSDRFGTNLEILKTAGNYAGKPVLIATATGFADSLSASATGLPMLLVYGKLTEAQKAFLATTSKEFIIIGGDAAVSADLEAELDAIGDVERVAGENRYQTSVKVAGRFLNAPEAAVLAYARNFPDGLCGGPLAYALGAPLILTDNYDPSEADTYVRGISAGIVVGGTGLISDAAARAIFDLAANTDIEKE